MLSARRLSHEAASSQYCTALPDGHAQQPFSFNNISRVFAIVFTC